MPPMLAFSGTALTWPAWGREPPTRAASRPRRVIGQGVGEPLLGVDVHGPRTGGGAPGGPYSRTFWSSPSVGPVRSHAARPP